MWDDGFGNVHHWHSGSAPRRRGTCQPARDYLITVTLRSQRNSAGEAAQDVPKTGIDVRISARCSGLCLIAHSNNKSDGPFVVVAKADGPLVQPERHGAACGCAMELDGRRAAGVGNDFQVDPADAVSPGTGSQGFGDGLFGGETGGEGFNAITAVAQFRFSVKALQEPPACGCGAFVSGDGPTNAFDLYDIDTCTQDHSLIGVIAAEFRLHHVVILPGLRRAACARTGWRMLRMGGSSGSPKPYTLETT